MSNETEVDGLLICDFKKLFFYDASKKLPEIGDEVLAVGKYGNPFILEMMLDRYDNEYFWHPIAGKQFEGEIIKWAYLPEFN